MSDWLLGFSFSVHVNRMDIVINGIITRESLISSNSIVEPLNFELIPLAERFIEDEKLQSKLLNVRTLQTAAVVWENTLSTT